MAGSSDRSRQRRNAYQPALDKARAELGRLDPVAAAARSGARAYSRAGERGVALAFWGRELEVAWPGGEVRSPGGGTAGTTVQLLVLHYLASADGAPQADRWLSFRELPDGRVYDAAYRRRACLPLARTFGEQPEALVAAALRLGGQRLTFGDASFMFQVLPRVRVAAILYRGDEEFVAEANVLFDAAVRHYLPIEDVAVLGGVVAWELIKARGQEVSQDAG